MQRGISAIGIAFGAGSVATFLRQLQRSWLHGQRFVHKVSPGGNADDHGACVFGFGTLMRWS